MPIPPEYNTVEVRGGYVYLDGAPAEGSVNFTGKAIAVAAASHTVIVPTTLSVNLVNGAFSIQLPATDDADVQPNGWTYKVEETFSRGGGRTFEMEVPLASATDGIDISSVAPLEPSSGDPTAFVTLTAFQQVTDDAAQAVSDAAQAKTDAATAVAASANANTTAASAVAQVGIERMPVSSGLSWTGAVDLTTLAATARTIRATLTGNVTLALPTPPSDVSYTITLLLTQDATGSRTLTLPAACLSAYGVDPVLTTSGGATDVIHLMWTGASWLAFMAAPAVA